MHVVIPNDDPLLLRLRKRAHRRGLMDKHRKSKRNPLPELARDLINERLQQLEENDPAAVDHSRSN